MTTTIKQIELKAQAGAAKHKQKLARDRFKRLQKKMREAIAALEQVPTIVEQLKANIELIDEIAANIELLHKKPEDMLLVFLQLHTDSVERISGPVESWLERHKDHKDFIRQARRGAGLL